MLGNRRTEILKVAAPARFAALLGEGATRFPIDFAKYFGGPLFVQMRFLNLRMPGIASSFSPSTLKRSTLHRQDGRNRNIIGVPYSPLRLSGAGSGPSLFGHPVSAEIGVGSEFTSTAILTAFPLAGADRRKSRAARRQVATLDQFGVCSMSANDRLCPKPHQPRYTSCVCEPNNQAQCA